MPRPTRLELLRKFFPELGQTGTGGETEAAIAINTRACEVILADLIKTFDKEFLVRGPGVLCVNLAQGTLARGLFVTLDELCGDLTAAEECGHFEVSGMLRDVISTVRLNNYDERVLILKTDKSTTSLLPIPRDRPASGIQRAQEAATL